MRLILLSICLAATLPAEFLRIEVKFRGVDCASCLESLRARLERVRGMGDVELDLDKEIVLMRPAAGNRVRLVPLLARITQDGTKVLETRVVVRGEVSREGQATMLSPTGLTETFRLELGDAKSVEPGGIYRISGLVDGATIQVESVKEGGSVNP